MDRKKEIIVNGVRFHFNMGAIAEWVAINGETENEVLAYCQDAISGKLVKLGNVLLASYRRGAKGFEQAVKLETYSDVWDFLDSVEDEVKAPLIQGLLDSVSDRLAVITKTAEIMQKESKQQKKSL